jgi:hypothetical protein
MKPMNTYRSAAVALTASSASASALASVSQAAPALASRTIKVSGDSGSFPIPARAKVVENVASDPGPLSSSTG